MPEYEVYYRRNETFMLDKKLKRSDIANQTTHISVALKVGDKDDVFREMQGEFMDAQTAKIVIGIIKGGGTHHQSMSVGDVIRDAKSGIAYQCDMVGWVKVK